MLLFDPMNKLRKSFELAQLLPIVVWSGLKARCSGLPICCLKRATGSNWYDLRMPHRNISLFSGVVELCDDTSSPYSPGQSKEHILIAAKKKTTTTVLSNNTMIRVLHIPNARFVFPLFDSCHCFLLISLSSF